MAACKIKLFIFLLILSFSCSHYIPEPGEITRGVWSYGERLLTRRSSDTKLKIMVYPHDSTVPKLSRSLKELIVDRLLPEAVEYFGQTLTVRQRISPIRLQRDCKGEIKRKINGKLFRYCSRSCRNVTYCGTVEVPAMHLDACKTCDSSKLSCSNTTSTSSGVKNTDFLLYISAFATSHCNNSDDILAYASTCQQEQTLDRPVAGFINFCAEKLVKSFHYAHLLAVVKHEIFHSLGFSSSLYGYYRADTGKPLTQRLPDGRPRGRWSDKVVKEVVRDGWQISKNAGSVIKHKVHMIVTPHVIKEVRDHFNCPTLEGAEIENQGTSGQRYTHLEKRVFENEAMTGVFTNNPVFSRITLAIMEDTGWYRANYNMAEDLDWGKNAGCLFAQNSCKAWIDHQKRNNGSILPYCTDIPPKSHTRTGCTHNHQGVGVCNLVKYSMSLPTSYQYFHYIPGVDTPSRYGGARALADYCPYFQELDWKENGMVVRGSNCNHENNNPSLDKNYALEIYGDKSSCFLQGMAWSRKNCLQTVTSVDWGSGCYSYECTINGLVLLISGQSYPCLFDGETINIKAFYKRFLYKGSIICPSCQVFCGSSCPLIESKYFYNASLSKKRNENVLICSSVSFYVSLDIIVLIFISLLVTEILH